MFNEIKTVPKVTIVNKSTPFLQGVDEGSDAVTTINRENLFNVVRNNPILLIINSKIISALLKEGYDILTPDGKNFGKINKNLIKKFLYAIDFETEFFPQLVVDYLLIESYINRSKVLDLSKIDSITPNITIPFLMNSKLDLKRLIEVVPTEFMEPILTDNKKRIKEYIYKDSSLSFGLNSTVRFDPKEIIHIKYLPKSGKTNSMSPIEAIKLRLDYIDTLIRTRLYEVDEPQIIDAIFNLKGEGFDSPNYTALSEALKLYINKVKTGNRKRPMVVSGENLTIEDSFAKSSAAKRQNDIEMLNYVLFEILSIYRINPASIGFGNLGDYDSALSQEGFYESINTIQNVLFGKLNDELFLPFFGFKLLPKKSYLLDEQREADTFLKKLSALKQGGALFYTMDGIKRYLNISDDDWNTDINKFDSKELYKLLQFSPKTGDLSKEGKMDNNPANGFINNARSATQRNNQNVKSK